MLAECKPAEVIQFLKAMYSHYSAGFVEIRSISRIEAPIRRDWLRLPDDLQPKKIVNLAQHCCNLAYQKYDVYVGVCPRANIAYPGQKSGREAVHQVGIVWVDLDNKVTGSSEELLSDCDIIVTSGNGWHGYKKLTNIRDVSRERDRKSVETNIRLFAEHICRGTDNVANVDRILRVAGTLNWKDKANPKPVRLLKCPGIKPAEAESRWHPHFNDKRLDALLASAEAGLLGRATPRIYTPNGGIIDDLDTAVVGLWENLQRAKTNPWWNFAVTMAEVDLPCIIAHVYGEANER